MRRLDETPIRLVHVNQKKHHHDQPLRPHERAVFIRTLGGDVLRADEDQIRRFAAGATYLNATPEDSPFPGRRSIHRAHIREFIIESEDDTIVMDYDTALTILDESNFPISSQEIPR